jgi:CTP synthase
MGGTMRLGGYDVYIKENTHAQDIFKEKKIRRRFRHRYEVNPKYVDILEKAGLIFSGSTKDGKIKQLIELKGHPFFMASQFHPEFTSSLEKPDEMFYNFIKEVIKNNK